MKVGKNKILPTNKFVHKMNKAAYTTDNFVN